MKFSIVTPAYNSSAYIEKCMKSVMNQSHTDLEHIIVDGGSTDETVDIIRSYEGKYPMRWISEKDNGMYDAINKGFGMADGQVFAWLNSDDEYMPWSLDIVDLVMINRPEIKWCTANCMYMDGQSRAYFTTRTIGPHAKSPKHIRKGWADGRITPFVMQECSFWARDLWERSGGLDPKYKAAGDYYLWKKFAETDDLYMLNTVLAAFRRHDGQITSNMAKYYSEMPMLNAFEKILAKTKVLNIIEMLLKPHNRKYLVQVEEIADMRGKQK